MPRKPALLLHLLNQVLKSVSGQSLVSSKQLEQPLPADRDAWCVHWKVQGQPWRTEPEIDQKRQHELGTHRSIVPDIEQGVYPFKGMELNRADVEWLLATHENEHGPVDWGDEGQRRREGLDLRGANLLRTDLRSLPLSRMRGGLSVQEWNRSTAEQREMAAIHLEGTYLWDGRLQEAFLRGVHLEGTNLRWIHLEGAELGGAHLDGVNLRRGHLEGAFLQHAHLEGADLYAAHLEGVNLRHVHLEGKPMPLNILEYIQQYNGNSPSTLPPANLQHVFFDSGTDLEFAKLGNKEHGFVTLADAQWNDTNLAVVNWSQMMILGDENEARQKRDDKGEPKSNVQRLKDFHAAVRANRQLAVALQAQGLNEDAARFAYRAQILQQRVVWFEMIQSRVKLRQRAQALGAWLFSWFLFLISGYGYRLWRSLLAYMLVIIGFMIAYYLLGASFKPPLSFVNALGLSMTSFHGRGFFPGVTQLNDTLTILASIEAFVGLVLEATFIATLTQRFFGK